MEILDTLDKQGVREFFSKGWMTHDAMWYYHCLQDLGPDRANKLNKDAIASMASVEIKRILKLMGVANLPIKKFDELKEIIDSIYKLILPEFMRIHYDFPEKNLFRGGFNECFAYEGVNKFSMGHIYECGITVRIKGWLDGLGVKYEMKPEFTGCLMHQNGKCEIDFCFDLE